jgi:serine/threonine protein kinase
VNDELVDTTLGHCVIRGVLGQGGMARVYRGYQQNLDREVAIKVLPPHYAADPSFVERFKLEARAMARLTHPNIVTVHDAGEENGRLYIVMAYIRDGTLKQRMGAPMDPRDVTRVIKDVASALTYAHACGIVHRDVKPVNVLIDNDGRAVLGDFGIAKMLEASDGLTRAGAGVGTPEYMSPEQCRGGAVDARTDIYALGVLLYEMLTGRTPYIADNYTALAHAHIYEQVPPPNQFNPRISPAVQSVVLKALYKDPAQRFQQATEMATALEQAVAAQIPVTPGPSAAPHHPLGAPPPYGQGVASGARPPAPSVYCPQCRQPNAPLQRFCSHCGTPLGTSGPPPGLQAGANGTAGMPYAQVACPRCRAPNPSINRFCTRCGYQFGTPGVACQGCGALNAPNQRFCTTCGRSLV